LPISRAPRAFNLFGFRLNLRGDLSAGQWRALCGKRLRCATSRPDLTVEFRRRDQTAERANSADVLRGADFELIVRERRLIYDLPRPPCRADALREDWVRTAAFGLGLLHEALQPPTERFLLYLHASAVATVHGALVFCGHSTFGKSTISQLLLQPHPVIDDDLAHLVCDRSGTRVIWYPQYVKNSFGHTTKKSAWALPIAGLFWIRKAPRFRLQPMSAAEAASQLLSPLLVTRSSTGACNRLRMLQALLARVPCQRLEFRRERPALLRFMREKKYL
jgi:hypothetical protein